jgi:hypothetical protein
MEERIQTHWYMPEYNKQSSKLTKKKKEQCISILFSLVFEALKGCLFSIFRVPVIWFLVLFPSACFVIIDKGNSSISKSVLNGVF